MTQREKPALQAVYDLNYNKRPTVIKYDRRSNTSRKLMVTPSGREEFEHPYSMGAIDLLDALPLGLVTYRIEESVENVDDSETVTDPAFIKRAIALVESLKGDEGSCTVSTFSGDITLETFAELGPAVHIKRRSLIEAFYYQEGVGLATGAVTLDCRHIFSANACKPLTLKTEATDKSVSEDVLLEPYAEGQD